MSQSKQFSTARKIQFTLFLLFIVLLLITAVGEVIMRLQYKGPGPPYDNKEKDAELGWKTKENYKFQTPEFLTSAGSTYPVNANFTRYGFRKWNEAATDSPVATIFFIGDSYTESLEASDEHVFYAVLKDSLPVRIYARGTAGYGTAQELLILRKYIDSVKPDWVVLEVCNNDFTDNSWQIEMHSTYKVSQTRPYLQADGSMEYHYPRPWYEHAKDYSLFWNMIFMRAHNTLLNLHMAKPDRDISEIAQDPACKEIYDATLNTTQQALSEIKKLTESRHAQLAVFDADDFSPGVTYFPDVCRRLNINYIDSVAQDLRAAEQRGDTIRAFDGYHCNNVGQHVIANRLIQYFRAKL